MVEEKKNIALQAENDHITAVESAEDYIENFDILETITNVGNDEVFTPRKICTEMLDSLPDEVWHNPDFKWLNPCTKNGIFEREIAIRLDKGLEEVIPNEEERKKHILQDMLFSIGLTKFTSHVARRTLYYCNDAHKKCDGIKAGDGHYVNGYAVGNGSWFNTSEGNILTPNTDHSFVGSGTNAKCEYCGIKEGSKYLDPLQREQYSYEFIHVNHLNLEKHLQELFFKGDKNMKFDIVIGNPPYQLSDGGAQASARPIYQLFVKQAKELNPRYLSMIIPSRWMTGGKGLDDFRLEMINDKKISTLHDFPNPKDCFPNNDIKGGVCYFVRDNNYDGKCKIYSHTNGLITQSLRFLNEAGVDIFVRNEFLVSIMQKVINSCDKTFDSVVSARKPYGLEAETMLNAKKFGLPAFSDKELPNCYRILGLGERKRRMYKFLPIDYPIPKLSPCFLKYKVFIAEAYGCGAIGEVASTPVLSTPVLSTPGDLCTETFLEIGPFDTENEAKNVIQFIKTKFFRALVGVVKQTQHTTKKVYKYVPLEDFTTDSDIDWEQPIDGINLQLVKKYELSDEEIQFIETNIKEM